MARLLIRTMPECDVQSAATGTGARSGAARAVLMITGLYAGGAERQLQELATRLPTDRWDVCILSLVRLPDGFTSAVRVYDLGMRRGWPDPRAVLRAWKVLRAERPDLLVTFLFHASLLGWLLRPFVGRPALIASVRNDRVGSRLRERLIALTNGLGDYVTVNSRLAAERMVRSGILPSHKTVVVPNGIDATQFQAPAARAETRRTLGIPADAFVWLAVARLEPAKGHATLLEAFALMRAQPDTLLLLAGGGALRPALQRAAAAAGVADRVRFLGFRPDVAELLAAADACVLASHWEGLPNAVMEAMAAGKPVVASAVGGVPELVETGGCGLLVPAGDASALAAAMLRVQTMSQQQRDELGAAGAAFVERHLNWPSVLASWQDVMGRALAGRASAGLPRVAVHQERP